MERTKYPDEEVNPLQPEHIKQVLNKLVDLGLITNDTRTHAQLMLLKQHSLFDTCTHARVCTSTLERKEIRSFQLDPLITPSMFELFWRLYPKKIDKGLAKTRWDKVCKKDDRPSWRVIEKAVVDQKNSDRWRLQPEYIPYPASWLNRARWLDNPKDMLPYPAWDSDKPKEKYFEGRRYKLAEDGYYYNSGGERWFD